VKTIRRATRKRHSSEEKIQIVLDGVQRRGEPAAGVAGRTVAVRHRELDDLILHRVQASGFDVQ